MKKLWFLLLLASPLLADDEPIPDPVNFGINDLSAGMYSYPDANKIPDNAANYIQNMYTDIQGISVERNGTAVADGTILGNPSPVTGLWTFVDVNGIEWLIAFSSSTYYKKQGNGDFFIAFGPKSTTSIIPTATSNLGKIWFEDGGDALWWFDGTSTGTVASAPTGTLITSWRNRLAVAGSAGALSTVLFSADGDGTNWTIGGGDSDPFTIQVGGANDGFPINCLYGMFQDTLIIGRKFDLWGTFGFVQSDEQTRKLTSEIGCIENRTMKESDGDLIWLSARGIERMNGTTINLISDPIRDLTDVLAKNTVNSQDLILEKLNVQGTSSDWGSGIGDIYIDTVSLNNKLTLIFPDNFSKLRNGSNGTLAVWTTTGNVTASGGGMSFQISPTDTSSPAVSSRKLINFQQGTTYQFSITGLQADLSAEFHVVISTILIPVGSPLSLGNSLEFVFKDTGTYIGGLEGDFLNSILQSGTTIDAIPSDSFLITSPIQIFVSTFNYQITITNPLTFVKTIIKTGAHSIVGGDTYVYFEYTYPTTGFYDLGEIGPFSIIPETATFTTQLIPIGSKIYAWGQFSAGDTDNGEISYLFGSTNVANISAITNYAPVSQLGIPTVSTNLYAAYKINFNINSSTDQAIVGSIDTQWFEHLSLFTNSWTWDRRYWMSFTTNTSAGSFPDTVLIYQRNKTWSLLKGINADSFTRWKDNLYFGDSRGISGDGVCIYDVGKSDLGNPIDVIIKTKSYDLGFPYRNKAIRKMYLGYMGGSGLTGTLNLSYDMDRSGNVYSLGSVNLNEYNGSSNVKFPFNLGTNNPDEGREIQYTLTKNDTGDPLHLYEFRTMFFLKEPR